ncbi:MAG: DNA translocase FtsK [Muribaculaceae bacterium]|nr:DNA translocase FtsK [Muribaculaceae bacterium]
MLLDRRVHGVLGVILMLSAVFALVSSISYISYGAADQSLVTNNTIDDIAKTPSEVKNMGGAVGAFMGNTLIHDWLGLGGFVLIFYVLLLGLALVRVKKVSFWSFTFRSLVLAIGVSILLGGITHPFPLGGLHGMFFNLYLTSHLGLFGRIIVLAAVVGIVAYVYLNDLMRLYMAYRERVAIRRERRRLQQEAREAKDAKVNAAMASSALEDDKPQEKHTAEMADRTLKFEKEKESEFEEIPAEDATQADPYAVNESTDPNTDELEKESAKEGDDTTFTVTYSTIEKAQDIKVDDGQYDHRAELSLFKFPTLDLLIDRPSTSNSDEKEQEANKERITQTLAEYQISIQRIDATVGPTITLYEIVPSEGERIAKIKRLEDDIALKLGAKGIRIIPIPDKRTIGIEVPNRDPQTVSMRAILESKRFQECKYALPMAMGATISGDVFIADLTKMPHLLVAGATGQGKSVGLNAIIASLLYKKHPSELKFVLIDPKMVEFSLYSRLERHYLAKLPDEEDAIITDSSKVVTTLNSLCIEMDQRYQLLRAAGVRSVSEYNAKFTTKVLNPEKGHRYLPYIVVIVDEFADLIMTAGKEVETPIARIAQKARAVGMHMIIATQRPSTNVITGIIKANFPGRIAFRVSQMVDSKTILDRTGANQLIGRGDMLFSINGELTRVQCAFIDTPEVNAICDWIDAQAGFPTAYILPEFTPENDGSGGMNGVTDTDSLFEECARIVVQTGQASTSSLQRRYSIGYNRAGKIMDQLEAAGIVGPSLGGKPRNILVDMPALDRILDSMAGNGY